MGWLGALLLGDVQVRQAAADGVPLVPIEFDCGQLGVVGVVLAERAVVGWVAGSIAVWIPISKIRRRRF